MSRILCIKGMFQWAENRNWKLIFISRGHVLRDWQWCKITDDDDEYMNAAAAHAAFVMAVSTARILVITWHKYSFTRHINIHKLHPLPEKNWLGLCRFCAGTGYIEIAVFVNRYMTDFMSISVRIFQNEHCSVLKNSTTISITKIGIVEHPFNAALELPLFVHAWPDIHVIRPIAKCLSLWWRTLVFQSYS